MAKFLSYFIACLLLSAIVSGQTNFKCADHPAYKLAKNFFISKSISGKDGPYFAQKYLDEFTASTPQTRSMNELGGCLQFSFDGQHSCCTQNITNFINDLSVLSGAKILEYETPFKKLAGLFTRVLKSTSCTGGKSVIVNEILGNTNLPQINLLNGSAKNCQVRFAKDIAKLNRGALCSICMGYEKLSDNVIDQKLVILQNSVNSFVYEIDQVFDCMTNLTEDETTVKSAISEMIVHYTQNTNCGYQDQNKMTTDIWDIFLTNKSDGKYSGTSYCTGEVLFNDRSRCEQSISGNSYIDSSGRRVLQFDQSDTVISQTKGIDIFLSNSNDENISQNYNYFEKFNQIYNFTNEQIQNQNQNQPTPTYTSVRTNFERKLSFLASFIGLMVLLAF